MIYPGLIVCCVALLLCPAFGQESRAGLAGRITDSSSAVVPGATVTATNEETNATVDTQSNEVGNYRIPFLLPGDYRVTVELARFKKAERRGVHLSVGSDVTLDFSLEMGEVSQTVTVTEAAPLVNTANADLGQVVDQKSISMATAALTHA